MTIKVKTALLGMLFSLLLTSPTAYATYKWIDEDGNVVYSQRPPPEGQYESIRVKPSKPSKRSPKESKSTKGSEWLKNSTDKRKGNRKIEAEEKKNNELRKKNCAKARKQLEIYTVYSRVKDDKGNFRRITDNERRAGQSEAKQAIREFCD